MDILKLRHYLQSMDQDEILSTLSIEVRNAKSLRKKVIKSQTSEMQGYSARKESASWSNSEQFEKSKDAIKEIVKHLI